VLVTLDTLRADHLGLYGYPRPTSPFLDELASRGVVFERAYAPMATTAPSHASIFTSLYPLEHGVVSNGRRLVASFPTLAQRLRASGLRTAGFVSAHAHWSPIDLDRGFEVFDARPRDSREVYRTADRTVDAALDWVSGCTDCDRLLLFVHLFDAHAPLRPPARHLDVFRTASPEARLEHAEFLEASHRVPIAFYSDDPGRMLFIMDRYDAEVPSSTSSCEGSTRGSRRADCPRERCGSSPPITARGLATIVGWGTARPGRNRCAYR
jgi:hypothetical protein